jgi:hypothetical protein
VVASTTVLGYLSIARPDMDRLSFLGMELGETFLERIAPGAVLAAALGLFGSFVLSVQTRLAVQTRRVDAARGAHRFARFAWLAAAGLALLALAVTAAKERAPAIAVLALAAFELTAGAVAAWLERAGSRLHAGPYRTPSETR